MADRIVVMLDGKIQQADTPAQLYAHPCNVFVAGFIGTPPMNILPGRLVRRGNALDLQVLGTEVALPPSTAKPCQTVDVCGSGCAFGPARGGSVHGPGMAEYNRSCGLSGPGGDGGAYGGGNLFVCRFTRTASDRPACYISLSKRKTKQCCTPTWRRSICLTRKRRSVSVTDRLLQRRDCRGAAAAVFLCPGSTGSARWRSRLTAL